MIAGHGGGESRQRLSTTAANADEERIAAGRAQHTTNARQVLEHVAENDQVHLVLVRVVVLVEALLDDAVHRIDELDLLVEAVVRVQIRVHEVAEHETAQVLFAHTPVAVAHAAVGQVLEDGVEVLLEYVLDTRLDRT